MSSDAARSTCRVLAIRLPRAADLVTALNLRARGVLADARGELLRLGPAPT